jgi:hypothetical protein
VKHDINFFSRKRRRTMLHYIKKIKMGLKSPGTQHTLFSVTFAPVKHRRVT